MTAEIDTSFVHEVIRLYRAEFYGEKLFAAVSSNTEDVALKEMMNLLMRLELTMQSTISQWLTEREVGHEAPVVSAEALRNRYGSTLDLDADQFIAEYHHKMVEVCAWLAQWEASAPAEGAAIARAIAEHDDVIVELMELYFTGDPDPAAPVEAFLRRLATPRS